MKRNKIFGKILFSIMVSFVLSAMIEVVFFNGLKLYNIGDDRGTFSLNDVLNIEFLSEKVAVESDSDTNDFFDDNNEFDDNDEEYIEDEEEYIENEEEYINVHSKKMIMSFDKKYIDRLEFSYKTNKNVSYSIYIKTFDEYGNPVDKKEKITFLKDFNKVSHVISGDVEEIILSVRDYNSEFFISDISIKNEFIFNLYRFIITFIFIITILLIYFFKNTFFEKIEYLFVILALCFGTSLIVITPCLSLYSWDDHIHFGNAYSLFKEGEVETTKAFDFSQNIKFEISNFPKTYEDFIKINKYLNEENNVLGEGIVNENKFISYDNYSYIPSATIISICKFLKLPFTFMFHSGKFINLIVYTLILFYAIRNAKIGKKLLFVLSLLPSSIFLSVQYSKDPLIIAGIYLAVSIFLNCYCTSEKMNKKNLILFLLTTIVACLSKAIYIPIILLIIIIPKEKFSKPKNAKWIKILTVILLMIIMSTFVLPTVSSNPSAVSDIRGGNTSTGGQLQLIISQPVSFAKVFIKYINDVLDRQLLNGQTLGRWHNFDILGNGKHYLILCILLICAVVSEKNEKTDKINYKFRLFIWLISLLIICLIGGSMYLSYTPVGYPTVSGVQMRYFIPLLYGIFITLKQKDIICKKGNNKLMIFITVSLVYIYYFQIYNEVFMSVCA